MPRAIKITPVLNGFICQVDCTTVVVSSLNALCEGLREYYTDPSGTEKKWLSNGINQDTQRTQLIARDPQNETVGQVVSNAPIGCGVGSR